VTQLGAQTQVFRVEYSTCQRGAFQDVLNYESIAVTPLTAKHSVNHISQFDSFCFDQFEKNQ